MKLSINLNGKTHDTDIDANSRLLDVLRVNFGLTGTKEGCGEGECGACTVIIDGAPVNSCLVAAASVEGSKIETIEAMAKGGILTAIQQSLVDMGGTQCGICTPAIALTASAAIAENSNISRDEIREKLAGNLCRCTGYQLIIDAVADASDKEKSQAGNTDTATGGKS